MKVHSEDRKQWAVEQMLSPLNRPVPLLSRETGIPAVTLYTWRRQAGGVASMQGRDPEAWSSAEKFQTVLETACLSQAELSEYCRGKGLLVEQVQRWRANCEQANGQWVKSERQGQDKEFKRLQRELQRKESALAEAAALLVLSKKAAAIWGKAEDE